MKLLFAILLILPFLIWGTSCTYRVIDFNRSCEGYLKRAADANTIELAKQELDKALDYIERNNLTYGYTSILYTTPDEDIGFWYTNIRDSRDEIAEMLDRSTVETVTNLEKSNMLMKLRETLTDSGEKGSTSVTAPPGISRYPYNTLYAGLGLIFTIAAIIGFFLGLIWFVDRY